MKSKSVLITAAVLAVGSIVAMPGLVQANLQVPTLMAQQSGEAPEIDSFTVNQVNQLVPGTELVFTVQGTPGSIATVTIANVVTNLPLQQTQPGVYEGRYTIRNQDRFTATTSVRANLQQNGRISSVRLQQPLIASTSVNSPATGSSPTQAVSIDRFTAQPVQQLEPGTELSFTLVGTPGARATFSIEGVAVNQPMPETANGTYSGRYVIRRQDYFPASGVNVVASLQSNEQTVRAQLDQKLTASNGSATTTTQLPLEVISPQANSRVSGVVEVRGRSAPSATVNVNVQATTSLAGLVGINRTLLEQNVQTNAQGEFRFTFRPSISVPGTRYQVNLRATQGNQTSEQTLVLIQQ